MSSPLPPDSEIRWIETVWFRTWDNALNTDIKDYYHIIHYKDGSTFETYTISNDLLHLNTLKDPDAEDKTEG